MSEDINHDLEERLSRGPFGDSAPKKVLKGVLRRPKPVTIKKPTQVVPTKPKTSVKKQIEVLENPVNLTSVPDGWQEEFLKKAETYQKEISRFLLVELISFETAIPAAVEDALDCVRMITQADSPELSLGKVQPLIQRMIEIKLTRHLGTLLELPPADIRSLVNEIMGDNNNVMQKLREALQLSNTGNTMQKVSGKPEHKSTNRGSMDSGRRKL